MYTIKLKINKIYIKKSKCGHSARTITVTKEIFSVTYLTLLLPESILDTVHI